MTTTPDQPEREEVLARPEDDDHDLLTYGEVGARLSEEIAAEKGRLLDWDRRLGDGEDVQHARDVCLARLEKLREALIRNRSQPILDANFERFFGFRGQARRNT